MRLYMKNDLVNRMGFRGLAVLGLNAADPSTGVQVDPNQVGTPAWQQAIQGIAASFDAGVARYYDLQARELALQGKGPYMPKNIAQNAGLSTTSLLEILAVAGIGIGAIMLLRKRRKGK